MNSILLGLLRPFPYLPAAPKYLTTVSPIHCQLREFEAPDDTDIVHSNVEQPALLLKVNAGCYPVPKTYSNMPLMRPQLLGSLALAPSSLLRKMKC